MYRLISIILTLWAGCAQSAEMCDNSAALERLQFAQSRLILDQSPDKHLDDKTLMIRHAQRLDDVGLLTAFDGRISRDQQVTLLQFARHSQDHAMLAATGRDAALHTSLSSPEFASILFMVGQIIGGTCCNTLSPDGGKSDASRSLAAPSLLSPSQRVEAARSVPWALSYLRYNSRAKAGEFGSNAAAAPSDIKHFCPRASISKTNSPRRRSSTSAVMAPSWDTGKSARPTSQKSVRFILMGLGSRPRCNGPTPNSAV
jgi:hypothetical protein